MDMMLTCPLSVRCPVQEEVSPDPAHQLTILPTLPQRFFFGRIHCYGYRISQSSERRQYRNAEI